MTRLSLETTDRAEADAFLREIYPLGIDPPSADHTFGLEFTSDPIDRVAVVRTRFTMELTITAEEPMTDTVLCVLRRGRLSYEIGAHDNRWRAGEVFVAVAPGLMWSSSIRDCDTESVIVDPATFGSVAQTADGRAPSITGFEPVSARAAGLWLMTLEHARRLASEHLPPLVAGSAARLLAATALATFPNDAATSPTIEDRRDAHPSTLRRAVAYIESRPTLDLTVVDIARAAHVTPRALQLSFRRHLDTTPMAYLRRVRLEHAHADLLTADPATTTVTAIAARWGFGNPGRFASYYAAAYGRAPGRVLGADTSQIGQPASSAD